MNQSPGSIRDRVVAWFRGLFAAPQGHDSAIDTDETPGRLEALEDKAAQTAEWVQHTASRLARQAEAELSERTGRSRGSASTSAPGETTAGPNAAAPESAGGQTGTADQGRGSRPETAATQAADSTVAAAGVTSPVEPPEQAGIEAPTAEDRASEGPSAAPDDDWWSTPPTVEESGPGPDEQQASGAAGGAANEAPAASAASEAPTASAANETLTSNAAGPGTAEPIHEAAPARTDTEAAQAVSGVAEAAQTDTSIPEAAQTDAAVAEAASDQSGAASVETGPGTDGGSEGTVTFTEAAADSGAAGEIIAEVTAASAVDDVAVGVDAPDTRADAGYLGSSPATDREGVGSAAPSAASGGDTGPSADDRDLVGDAQDDAEARAADEARVVEADAAAVGSEEVGVDATTAGDGEDDIESGASDADADTGTSFEEQSDTGDDFSTAQAITVGGLIAEDEQETGGEFADELIADAETQQAELPAADYADQPTEAVETATADSEAPKRDEAASIAVASLVDDQAGETAAPADAEHVDVTGEGTAADGTRAPVTGEKGVNWIPGDGTNHVPAGFPIKGNANSMIYHPVGSPTYARTVAEFYFATPADAEAAGYRLPKAMQGAGDAVPAGGAAGTRTATATRSTGSSKSSRRSAAKQAASKAERPTPKGAIRAQGAVCPADHPIKGNANSRIYHLPSESSYDQTIPEFCFATEDDAKAAGFRPRKH